MAKKKEEAKKEATTAVVKKEVNLPSADAAMLQDEMPVDSRDLMISKILTMQGLSALVQEDKAKIGEIRDSVSGKLLADKEEKMEAILFKPFRTWIIFDVIEGKEQFREVVPFTGDNADWARQDQIEGTPIVRYNTLNYYSLLPSEIKAGDYRPRVISLRSTGYKIGKKIETTRAFLAKAKVSLPYHTFHLYTTHQQNDKGKWYILDVAENRKTTEDELKAVLEWVSLIKSSTVVHDNTDLEDEKKANAPSSGEVRPGDKF